MQADLRLCCSHMTLYTFSHGPAQVHSTFNNGLAKETKWASWQNQQNGMCTQQRLRSAWASAQFDQGLQSLATHWVHSEDSDQIWRMPRLIRVFVGRTVILLVLSWGGSNQNLHIKFFRSIKLFSSPNHILKFSRLPLSYQLCIKKSVF